MQIVSDRGMDLAPEQLANLNIHFAPLRIILDGITYTSGIDIQPDEFYQMLGHTDGFPLTSQPSAGEFAHLYQELSKQDNEILSIHISSGLSGTLNAARAGAAMVPEVKVTFWDSKTLSVPLGWQVQAAAQALIAGWSIERILTMLAQIRLNVEGIFTLSDLKYLIHGGRISHMKGLVASLLAIKPIIMVDKISGAYITAGQEITLNRAISKMVDLMQKRFGEGTRMRIQPLHGSNLEAIEILRGKLASWLDIRWEPLTPIAPVLGAHTGPSMVGMAIGPLSQFELLPVPNL